MHLGLGPGLACKHSTHVGTEKRLAQFDSWRAARAVTRTNCLLLTALLWLPLTGAAGQELTPPHFHHLALNSKDPDAAITFYLKEFPSTTRTSWEGPPALASPTLEHSLLNSSRPTARRQDRLTGTVPALGLVADARETYRLAILSR